MPLGAQAQQTNLEKSLNVYLHTQLVTGLSLDVHFPHNLSPFVPAGATWVRIDYVWAARRQGIAKVSTTERGSWVTSLVNCNCCEFVAQHTTNRYALQTLRDSVRGIFVDASSISIQDYDTGGNPVVGRFVIENVTDAFVQDGFGPDTNGIAIMNISVQGRHLESIS